MFSQRSHSTHTFFTLKFTIIMLVVACAVRFASAPIHAVPAATTFTVNSNSDAADAMINGICETGNGNKVCTLRAAIMEANATSGATINFSLPGSIMYLLTLGELNLTANMSIVGNGAANTIIDGDANSRVLDVSSSSLVINISGVTIQNGKANQGGGINNVGKLSLSNTTILDNVAAAVDPKSGGGIYNTGVLTVTNSFINGNSAPNVSFTGGGGGIYNNAGTVLLLNSTLDSNSTNSTGGAIQVDGGTVSLVNSMVNSNIANAGGGIFNGALSNSGTLNLTQSGIYSNTAQSTSGGGGGLYNYWGVATLINSTIYLNVANNSGGGLYNDSSGTTSSYNTTIAGNYSDWDSDNTGVGGGINRAGGTVNFRNTLLGGNYIYSNACISCSTPDDCAGTLNSEDYNLIQSTSGCTLNAPGHDITGVDPELSYPAAFNGGPTLNIALFPFSPAVNAGNTGGCRDGLGALIPTDQRGFIRPFPTGGRCDIGAYEFGWTIFLPIIVKP